MAMLHTYGWLLAVKKNSPRTDFVTQYLILL